MSSNPIDTVSAVRQAMRRQRRALGIVQQRRAASALVRNLVRLPALHRSRSIACYIAADGEIDPSLLIDALRRRKKNVYLPVLMRGNRLRFAPYERHTALVRNRFGIPEPKFQHRNVQASRTLDLVLMPLVAFDTHGHRVGMGGGFYDRSFAYLRRSVRWRRPKLIGLAHEFQRVDTLAARPWDVPLHGVVTDRSCYFTAKQLP